MIVIFRLQQTLDDTIMIDNKTYHIDMSFDNILLLFDLLNDQNLNNVEKILQGINVLLGVSFLYDFETQVEIFNQIIEQFIMSEDVEPSYDVEGNLVPTPKRKKHFDLNYDAEYIYASFMQTYQIDLLEEQGKLHWYKFKALLDGLPEDTKFRQVIDIRTRDYSKGKGTAKENKQLKKLKELYALPQEEGERNG